MAIDPKLLQHRWCHSHEEDSSNTQVFRPDSYSLPPSRGRSGYAFQSDGSVLKTMPGPTDRPTTAQGTWTVDDKGRLTIRIQGCSDEVLQIDSLDSDRLVVKKQ